MNLQTEKSADTGLTSPIDVDADIHKQKCKDHTDENQSFYCEKHYACICGRCLFSNHFSCLEMVVDLNNAQHDAEHVNKSVSTLHVLDEEIDHIMSELDENRRQNDKCRSIFTEEIHEFHGSLVQQLNMLMAKAEEESDNFHKQNIDVLDDTELKCKEHKQVLRQHIQYLNELEHKNHYRHLFVALKKMEMHIDSLKDKNVRCRHENRRAIQKYEFVSNLKFDELIGEDEHIGTLKIECDGSEEVIDIVDEKASAVADERTGDERNEDKTSDEKANTQRDDRLEHERVQGTQRHYDEEIERLKELEESIRKREETHSKKEIEHDEKLKCLKENEIAISNLEKSINFEKGKCESMKQEYEQKIKKLQETLWDSEKKIKNQEQDTRIKRGKERKETDIKRNYEMTITKLRKQIENLEDVLFVSFLLLIVCCLLYGVYYYYFK
ncbi:golgin subfamily A member 6-like protein 22 isoform X2 [Dreissena polymorpha]|uniref:golgin subfamily A member 6-like protein 22 isoform X2 n=1 Tax=Dreissena polymorpha TaxID=45954 RepID=UPI002263B10C|nr:golgin subfamily A member 6-like protein 22 isoform X2 [Dreissena polymorpha]